MILRIKIIENRTGKDPRNSLLFSLFETYDQLYNFFHYRDSSAF